MGNPEINIVPAEELGFQLTKEFLELAFDREVEKFSTNAGTNPGDNYMSVMHAIEVTFKGDKKSSHYLIKCYPNHQGRRDYLDEMDVFSKEFFIYQDFLPQLKELAEERGAENIVDLSVAPVQGGNIVGQPSKFTKKPWSDENFILMTDLRKTFGFTMADRMKGLDLEHTKLVLDEIAKYHALSWAYKQKHGMTLLSNKYPQFEDHLYDNETMMKEFTQLMDQIVSNGLKMTEEKLGPSHPACKSLKDNVTSDALNRIQEYFGKDGVNEDKMESHLRIKPENDKDYNKEPWLLGTHGDCWLNNMLFLYNDEEPKKPVKVTLVDWQITREGCPTVELAYFLFSSVRAPLRIANLDDLLKFYHDAFLRYCEALQVKPLKDFTFETLKRRFRRAEYFGVLMALPLLCFVLKPKDQEVDLDKVESDDIGDVYAAVIDGSDKNVVYADEVSATILNLYEKGVI
ncbi:hypothetical protein Ocin01_07131 [Orchesella cincta]|uniref:CHK kinase-like domain-containing protein n=1 Tax=Orchesella cincta TaxID=48709 RepID=A0A1D2N3D0_ORCCI|nr:hypothetical protein Ocin01_07131 [Orchesella cincta]